MKQSDLDRAVASVTGETISTIRALGFVPLTPVPYEHEPYEPEPHDREGLAIDWDESARFGDIARPVDELVVV